MSDFIVSARKYRPATFASVVGQKHITSTLRNAIERGQLAHAYLFCGPRGVGKTTCARIFAKAINCLHPHGAEACNECESCRAFNEGRSLNIHELDAASNNSVEDIRTLIDQVRVIPQVGRYSVFIIDEVHMLSAAAFNAFLKTLEEPPAHAIFILATTEKHKIIPTILSRCQIYDFNRIRVEDGVEYLKYIASQEGITYDEESLNLIAQKADGGMRDALSMFDKAVSFCGTTLRYPEVAQTLNVLDYDTYFNVTQLLLEGNYVEALVAFDQVLCRGFSGQAFMAGLNRHMRDLLMAKRPETLRLIEMTGTLLERYRTQAEACSVEFLFGAISILTELDGKIRQSSNQRLLVELGLMKISGLGQKKNNPLTTDADYPLPELDGPAPRQHTATAAAASTAPAATRPAPQPAGAAASRPAAAPTPAAAPQTAPRTAAGAPAVTAAAQPQNPEGAPARSNATAASAQPGGAPSAATTAPAAGPAAGSGMGTAAARPRRSPLGTSLSELLATTDPAVEAEEATAAAPVIDPQSEAKLQRAREAIFALIREKRPRFVAAFEQMQFIGNTICVSVPTAALREEMLRSKTEMLMRIVELAGIHGTIDLEVKVNEQIRASRPIKLEDRMRYITEKNPLVAELRKALDLEAE
ncbi:DNA polymerase III subunit gamma/tau [Alistipes sp. An31A]|uniref:DNA polymerase III subunit gamma/tau n=1 Tax=Alistipes sp. An31A TaxID=1965631 RepID=UPI000B37E20F|nr:DNA polymerase III subunit gamma/tau [Alistipes sp. An31A]OUO23438.1 DNA polymerase III subunit gamma/tau [Alistipes sp. An31A]